MSHVDLALPRPLVSVIVAVHDVAELVGACIDSLKAQSLVDFEALIVDDGSTDGSGERAAAAAGGDPRFRIIRQENRGLSGARNTGLTQAKGRFIAFLDGDDAYAPAYLETLHQALEREGTDWAACGIALVFPDGTEVAHQALHGATAAQAAGRLDLRDAREAVRVFPSAWNKLYRRSLFDGLVYPEGSWFEDHEVFWALVGKAPDLAYVPDALYRHRRDRPGQITGTDSDRVFEQLRVLDRLHPQLIALPHGPEAFARLATRLVHERALVLRDRDRRSRFLTATWSLLDRCGVAWDPNWDPEISRGLGLALAGDVPLSIVVLDPEPQAALASLEAQTMADFEILVPAGASAPGVLPSGAVVRRVAAPTVAALAAAAAGRWVLLLGPGEALLPDGAMRLLNLAERTGGALAIGAMERRGAGYHDGWTDNAELGVDLAALPVHGDEIAISKAAALRLYPAFGNRIVRRDLLASLPHDLPLAGDAVSAQALVLDTALASGRTGYTRLAVARMPDRPEGVPPMIAARRAARALAVPEEGLPQGWRGLVFFRLIRLRQADGRLRWLMAVALAIASGWLPTSYAARPDPESPRWLRRLANRWRRRD